MQSGYFTERRRELRKKQTPAEKIMWESLRKFRDAGFIFRRQYSIDPYIVDFFCLKAGLVVEIDGGIHEEAGHKEYDSERTMFLKGCGYQTIRFRNDEVMADLENVLNKIKTYLQ